MKGSSPIPGVYVVCQTPRFYILLCRNFMVLAVHTLCWEIPDAILKLYIVLHRTSDLFHERAAKMDFDWARVNRAGGNISCSSQNHFLELVENRRQAFATVTYAGAITGTIKNSFLAKHCV
jgi:hypothetical protein